MRFDKKNVLVTGASRGIGRAIALQFAGAGARGAVPSPARLAAAPTLARLAAASTLARHTAATPVPPQRA